jgi:protein-S-isoprenylcysteine O-methyltransferase Ste14
MTNSLSIASFITIGLWCVLIIYVLRGAKTASAEIEHPASASLASRIIKILGMLYLFALIYSPRWVGIHPHPMATWPGRAWIGVAICAAGVALVIASRRTLGRNWSDLVVLKRNHELIQSGPYRWIRHPLYSGMLLAILGSAITVNFRLAYIAVPIVWLGFWLKARREEALLEQQFPEYRHYRQRVKAFIPSVL